MNLSPFHERPVVGWPLILRSSFFISVVIILVGILLRLRIFFLNDLLWLDEASLASKHFVTQFQGTVSATGLWASNPDTSAFGL